MRLTPKGLYSYHRLVDWIKETLDEAKLEQFIGKAVTEWGAAMGAMLILIGYRLGLFKAMAGAGPLTSEQLASKTNTHPRIIREWLAAQAAGGYVTYDSRL